MTQAMRVDQLQAAEQTRVGALQYLIARLEQAERDEVDREQFGKLFSLSTQILELDQETVAQKFKISRPTISRWETGKSAPHPLGRKPVFQLLTKLAKERLRRHTPEAVVSL